MTLRSPLSVRINDGVRDQHVTRFVTGLKFAKQAPGGHARVSMTINLPRSAFPDLGPADKIFIYGPTGTCLWQGFADNPGSADGPDGASFELSGLGTMILASDESRPLIYRDTGLDKWSAYSSGALGVSANASSADDPAAAAGDVATQGLLMQFAPGSPVATNAAAQMGYNAIGDAGMTIAGIVGRVKSGKTDTGFVTQIRTSGGAAAAEALTLATMRTVSSGGFARRGGTHFAADRKNIGFGLRRSGGATNVTDDDTWSFFDQIAVTANLLDRYGFTSDPVAADLTGLYAHQVVSDLIGRMLGRSIDSSTAFVDFGGYQIDQLSFPDGANAAQVFAELERVEPDLFWWFGPDDPGGVRFAYMRWPTQARYEITTRDGYEATGAESDLCNRIAVYWTDAKGAKKVEVVTASSNTYPDLKALEEQGRIKDAEPITLPEGLGSLANAQRIGTQALAAKAEPPKAARAVLRRRVLDLTDGRWVMPYEVEPGCTVRVRETGDVLRLTETEFNDDEGSLDMQLGTPILTEDQRFAALSRK